MSCLRDLLESHLPDVLSCDRMQRVKAAELTKRLRDIEGNPFNGYKDKTLTYHYSVAVAHASSRLTKQKGEQGYYLRKEEDMQADPAEVARLRRQVDVAKRAFAMLATLFETRGEFAALEAEFHAADTPVFDMES